MASSPATTSLTVPPTSTATQPSPPLAILNSKFDPHLVSIKLSDDNYLPWKQQALAIIRGYKLQKFLLGAHASPTRFSSPANEAQGNLTEEFLAWEQQDQFLLSWILASMSDGMLTKMVGCEYSYQAWEKLELFFASQIKAKVRKFKAQLRSLKKGTMTATEYLLKLKKIVDSLASVGSPIGEADHIEAILEGLPEEYTGFIVSIASHSDPYTVYEIESLLVAQEEHIEKYKKESTMPINASIAQAQSQKKFSSKPSGISSPSQPRAPNPSASFGRGNGNSARGNFCGGRRGGGHFNSTNRPQCQVCGKPGHMAWQCYHRFNQSFISPFAANPQQSFSNSSFPRSNTPSGYSQPFQAMVAHQHLDVSYDSSWYPDSGASNHITPQLGNLATASEYGGSEQIHLANGLGIPITHIGKSSVQTCSSLPLTLNSLLHVPSATKNLISVSKITFDNKVFFEFHANRCLLKCQDTQRVLLQGTVKDGLYRFPPFKLLSSPSSASHPHVSSPSTYFNSSVSSTTRDPYVWHNRLGHASNVIVNYVLKSCNLLIINKNHTSLCSACCFAKSHSLPYSSSTTVYSTPLELIHCDVWEPAPIISSNNFNYYVHFTDAYSRFTWLYLLHNKSDVSKVFTEFKNMVELQFNTKIKALQSDGGGEFLALSHFLKSCGIQHCFSCPYTRAHNGLAERKHRHLIETTLALLNHASMPQHFWDEALITAVFLINRLPTPVLQMKSPFEILYHKSPDYTLFRTFGCTCYPHLRPYTKHELEPRFTKCTFLGYSPNHKG